MDPLLELVITEMKQDIRDINSKVDKLLQFKWQIVTGGVVISTIITILIQVLSVVFK